MNARRWSRKATVVTATVVTLVLVGGGIAVARVLMTPPTTSVTVTGPQASAQYGAAVEIAVTLRSGDAPMTGPVTLTVGDLQEEVVTDAKGTATYTVPAGGLEVGNHSATASYARTQDRPAGTGTTVVEVVPASTTLTLTMPTSPSGAQTLDAAVQASTGVDAAGAVSFTVGGKAVGTVAVTKGKAVTGAPTGLSLGTHEVTASFTPATGQVAATKASKPMSVTKHSATVTASSTTPTVRYGDTATLSLAVTSAGGDKAGPVSLAAGGTTVATGTTDAAGNASLTFLNTADPGTTTYAVAFGGNGTTGSATGKVTVATTQTNVDIMVDTPGDLEPGAAAAIAVSVVGTPKPPSGAVTVSYDGAQIATGNLDAAGKIGASVPAVPAGDHEITVAYAGDARFEARTTTSVLSARPPVVNPNTSGAAAINADNPCPATASACVDLSGTVAWLQSGGKVTYGPVPITSGRAGHRTGTGTFSVYWLDKDHRSSIFNDAPMPNSVFFDGGIAFHAGSLSDQSHGCIHLSYAASEVFFESLSVGEQVYVFGTPPY